MTTNLVTLGQLLFAKLGIDIDEVSFEQLDHYIAVENFLMDEDEPPPDATNLEKVRRYLEAFHHLCEVKEWERANKILSIRLDTPTNNNKLHDQLQTWGYYRQAIGLYKELLEKLNANQDIIFLNGLGHAYSSIGEFHTAIEYSQKSLAIACEIGDRRGEAGALGNLGIIYGSQGDYHQASTYHQQSLAIAHEVGDRQEEARAQGNLGNCYGYLGDLDRAIDCFRQYLELARELGNRDWEAKALGNLGNAYLLKGDYDQAITYFEQNLAIAKEMDERAGIGTSLGNLGAAYGHKGDYPQAIDYLQQYLSLAQKIEDVAGQGYALSNLGEALIKSEKYSEVKSEKYSEALEKLQTALDISRKIGDRFVEVQTLKTLADAYHQLGNFNQALEYCDRASSIATEIGIPLAKECQELKEKLLAEEA